VIGVGKNIADVAILGRPRAVRMAFVQRIERAPLHARCKAWVIRSLNHPLRVEGYLMALAGGCLVISSVLYGHHSSLGRLLSALIITYSGLLFSTGCDHHAKQAGNIIVLATVMHTVEYWQTLWELPPYGNIWLLSSCVFAWIAYSAQRRQRHDH
jgi:hypothetical protein